MRQLKEKYKRFREWQQQPHQVAPLSEAFHNCATCGTHYQGNYCPRCGQSAAIGRYSAKKAFLLFLDVWGLGNRGMFRSLRDLLFRPGYMIRDYLQGMQMAYFPPFKMFFLLAALEILVLSGLNIQGNNSIRSSQASFEVGLEQASVQGDQAEDAVTKAPDDGTEQKSEEELAQEQIKQKVDKRFMQLVKNAVDWFYANQTLVSLIALLLISGPLYLVFRHSPAIPDIRFSEFFVAMVYITNMRTFLSIVFSFLCIGGIVELLIYLLAIIPLKQLSGYSYWSTTVRAVITTIISVIVYFILFVILVFTFGILFFGLAE